MNKKHDHIEHNFLKRIWSYLSSDKKGTEANEFEKQLEDDPFLNDAMEGYKSVPDSKIHSKNLKEIEDFVSYRTSQSRLKVSNFRTLRIAASILILFTTSIWIWSTLNSNSTKQTLSDAQESISELEYSQEEAVEEEQIQEIQSQVDEEKIEEEHVRISEAKETAPKPDSRIAVNEDASFEIEEELSDEVYSMAPLSSASVSEKAIITSQSEQNIEELLHKIFEMESEYWIAQNTQENIALNDAAAGSASFESAPISMDDSNFNDLEEDEKSPSVLKKSKRALQAAEASKDFKSEQIVKEEFSSTSKLNHFLDSVFLEIGQKQILDLESSNLNLFKALFYLNKGDTSQAVYFLNQNLERSSEQLNLMNSLKKRLVK